MIPRLSFLGLHHIVLHIKMHIFTYESARIHTSYTESLASCWHVCMYLYMYDQKRETSEFLLEFLCTQHFGIQYDIPQPSATHKTSGLMLRWRKWCLENLRHFDAATWPCSADALFLTSQSHVISCDVTCDIMWPTSQKAATNSFKLNACRTFTSSDSAESLDEVLQTGPTTLFSFVLKFIVLICASVLMCLCVSRVCKPLSQTGK